MGITVSYFFWSKHIHKTLRVKLCAHETVWQRTSEGKTNPQLVSD